MLFVMRFYVWNPAFLYSILEPALYGAQNTASAPTAPLSPATMYMLQEGT